MLSLKRLMYIVLVVAVLGGMFLVYNIHENRPAGTQIQNTPAAEREFIHAGQMDEGEKPLIWILGDSGNGIYGNVRQLCEDLHLPLAGEGYLDADRAETRDLVIFCDASVCRYADAEALERFIAGGGRVILAAGFAEDNARLRQVCGIAGCSTEENFHELAFEKPLLPVQPEGAYYDGDGGSFRMEADTDASVYIRDGGTDVPILYTYPWRKGGVCLINGNFLKDIRYMGLLTGAISALLPDFIYPVLGVKSVFLDNFPVVTSDDNEVCKQVYGYSALGFVQDVVWPAFQGMSLRSNTPYTSCILAAAPSAERFEAMDDALFAAVAKSLLQFGGEMAYAADCPEDGRVVLNRDFLNSFSAAFPDYTVRGLAVGNDSAELPDIPGADIRFVRGMLENRNLRLSWKDGLTVFPAATCGNSMEDGNLFSICSVLGAYGMVSHVFEADAFIARDGNAAWDDCKQQLALFEELLSRAPWLEGRTLSRTEGDVRSYQGLDYGWKRSGSRVDFYCGGAAKGQAFFYHTDGRVAGAEGLSYEDAGNGYYLLRVQENHGVITLEEGR